MDLNWRNIRSINGDQNDGFEEFVCQLANREFRDRKSFWRVGNPDGGKECFCEFENGEIYAWQAKYFLNALGNSQWNQIDDSVKNAISNHPYVTKIYIALPIDMPDPKSEGKKSMMDKWAEKVEEWKEYAGQKGMMVDFEYWGSHEMIEIISKPQLEGFRSFWFNELEITSEWLKRINQHSINALGPRYTPSIHFQLPISQVFEGLSLDEGFEKKVYDEVRQLRKSFRKIPSKFKNIDLNEKLNEIIESFKQLTGQIKKINFTKNEHLSVEEWIDYSEICRKNTIELVDKIQDYENINQRQRNLLLDLLRDLSNFINFLQSPNFKVANNPYLILTGKAGSGKSHLIGDVVDEKNSKNEDCLFLLGENFSNNDLPWTQILNNHIIFKGNEETFLGALNAKAEINQKRLILFIDAINEGNGKRVWPNNLQSFLDSFENYPWVGVVLTFGNTFKQLIEKKENITSEKVSVVENTGFQGFEAQAASHFFKHYRIIQPAPPIFNPEFQNPLFLKTVCKAIRSNGYREIPEGFEGLTSIIQFYLDGMNKKLADPRELDYDEGLNLVETAVDNTIEQLIQEKRRFLTHKEANQIIDSIFKDPSYNPEPFLQKLISEGIFNTDVNPETEEDVVFFAFEKFQDYLIISRMVEHELDFNNPVHSFNNGELGELIKDPETSYYHENLIEALSIKIPEKTGLELFEIAPHAKTYLSVKSGFIESIRWRKNESFGESSLQYVNEFLAKDQELFERFLEVVISTSLKPNFFFNAERLHKNLLNWELAKRDKI